LVPEPPRCPLAYVAPARPLAARVQQAERMRPKQGFCENRPTFSEISDFDEVRQHDPINYHSAQLAVTDAGFSFGHGRGGR
jgi:hypothetical protein